MKDIRHKTKQGIQAGVFGLFLNLGLALMKLMGGFLSKSQALVADGINSFFDSLSALITIIGLKVSLKPEDFDHPYGHSRFEYIAGFMISLIMAVVGFDVLKQSIQGILNPSILLLSPASFIIVFTSFTLKGILAIYYHKQYKLTGIKILKASKQDSFNDLLMSFSILFGFVAYHFFNIKVDAYLALAFSFVILYQSYKTISQFVNELIGKRPDVAFLESIKAILDENTQIFGYHDLLVHQYGDGYIYASVHLELDQDLSLIEAHDIMDAFEVRILEETSVRIVAHVDPLDIRSSEIHILYQDLKSYLKTHYAGVTFHDFRRKDDTISFDLVLNGYEDSSRILEDLKTRISLHNEDYRTNINIDHQQLL